MIKTENIARALIGLIEDGNDPKDVVDNFVNFAKKHNMESRIKNVLNVLEDKLNKEVEHETMYIKTAHDVPAKLLTEIKKYLKLPEDAPSHVSLDKKILGGFRVSYKNKLYEYGLKLRLNKLKNHLHSNHLK
jgi:F0F1-type ATP synthase delta subunit